MTHPVRTNLATSRDLPPPHRERGEGDMCLICMPILFAKETAR